MKKLVVSGNFSSANSYYSSNSSPLGNLGSTANSMKSKGLRLSGLFMAVMFLSISFSQNAFAKTPMAEIGKNKVKLEVAQTPEQIQRGLMFRQSMPEDAGMVFLFHPPRNVRFWMYHCFISLDMIFIKDGKIVKISNNVPPCRSPKPDECPLYPAEGEIEVSEVVEVNAGYCKRHGVKEGDAVNFTLDGAGSAASGKASADEAAQPAKTDSEPVKSN